MCPSKRSSFAQASSRIESNDVHRQARVVDDPRQLGREAGQALVVALVGVVLEVLLELVEDDEQRARAIRPGAQRLGERRGRAAAKRLGAGELFQRLPGGFLHARDGVVAPRRGTRRPRTGSRPRAARASSRRSCTAPACSSELLPTPLGPYRIVSRDERRFAATIAASVERPKKNAASCSS